MFIVNAPMLFTGIWAIVKGFLDEKTRKKITIKGGTYLKDIVELVDEENLPEFLGGKCKCEEFGGCMQSNAGPWNDYEIINPIGIRKKQESDQPQSDQPEPKAVLDKNEEEKSNQ